MVEGQGPVTPGNRRKRIGANSPAESAEDEIDVKTLNGFFLLSEVNQTGLSLKIPLFTVVRKFY